MTLKKCTKCGELKDSNEFYKETRIKWSKDGLTSACRSCFSTKGLNNRRTKEGLICQIYSAQKQSSINRNHHAPTYSMLQLRKWCFSQKLFHELYDNWKAGGYKKELRPSCDRTDDYKGYSLERLKLMTWGDNCDKGNRDQINGKNNKVNKAVIGINKITGEQVKFHSMREAERKTGIAHTGISACCLNKPMYNSAGGFTWKFN